VGVTIFELLDLGNDRGVTHKGKDFDFLGFDELIVHDF